MRTILQVNPQDINENFLQTLKMLIRQNGEILIQPLVELEEYDPNQPIKNITQALKKTGYNNEFLNDIEQGLKTSSVYAD